MKKDRTLELALQLAASPADVWRAIAEADGVASWFAPDVSVTPGEGGRWRASWAEGMTIDSTIEVWEPERRLRLVETLPHHGDARLVTEWSIAVEGGATTLRLVVSGFGDDASWDDEYDGLDRGWRVFFEGLRFALARHAGERPVNICEFHVLPQKAPVYDAVLARLALAAPAQGRTYEARGPGGSSWTGEVLLADPGRNLVLTVRELGDALFRLEVAGTCVTLMLIGYGDAASRVEQLRAPLHDLALQVTGQPT